MSKYTRFGHNILSPLALLKALTGIISRFALWKGVRVQPAVALFFVIVALPGVVAQTVPSKELGSATIEGHVFDAKHQAIEDVAVRLQQDGSTVKVETRSDSTGSFSLAKVSPGTYTLTAEKLGLPNRIVKIRLLAGHVHEMVELTMDVANDKRGSSGVAGEAMEFADKPDFTVAGVTDWTAVGGHGTDSSVHTSEELTRETLRLRPTDFTQKATPAGVQNSEEEEEHTLRSALINSPSDAEANLLLGEFYLRVDRVAEALPLLKTAYALEPGHAGVEYDLAMAYKDTGDFVEARSHVQKLLPLKANANVHRLAAEIDEKLDDPLAAVHEYELSAQLEPSEQNYFEWGSELLLHRAADQAQEVFAKGVAAYPNSARMLSALGTSLLANARYEEAAKRLCEASDLDPEAEEPYLFLGRIQIASPTPLACVEPRLARFAQTHPGNSVANYFYAMTLSKQQEQTPDNHTQELIESLLTKAATLDSNCADAYLQLGILHASQHLQDKAVEDYLSAIHANPDLSEAHYRLGLAYDRLHKPENARHEFQIHDELEKEQANALDRQRREIKQFRVVPEGQPDNKSSND